MAEARVKINFNNSMTLEKRDENFAYLRQGVMKNRALALYPENGFVLKNTHSVTGSNITFVGIDGENDSIPYVVVYDNGDKKTKIYYKNNKIGEISGTDRKPVCVYSDSHLWIADPKTKKIYDETGDDWGDFDQTARIEVGSYDGSRNWFVGGDIWRHSPPDDPVLMFTNTGLGSSPYIRSVCEYKNQLVIFADIYSQNTGIVLFWDKKNTTQFEDRVDFVNKNVLAGGVVNGELRLVTFERRRENRKELYGVITVFSWNGFVFKPLNEVEVYGEIDVFGNNIQSTYNHDYLYLAINKKMTQTKKGDLFKPVVYRINSLGEIDTMETPELASNNDKIVGLYSKRGLYTAVDKTGDDSEVLVYTNEDETSLTSSQGYGTFSGSTYITNFYCNPYNYHRLQGLSLSFEKLFNLEELDVYYRDSDRKDWTKLVTINKSEVISAANKQGSSLSDEIQRYQITLMPDGSSLPEFHEIQFKFVSKQGFSVIGAWFEYDYITRHNIK